MTLREKLSQLLQALRRRRVFRAGGLYGVSALAVLGALDLARDLLPWLDRAFPTLVAVGILLFPLVMILAWVFDWNGGELRLYRPAADESMGTTQWLTVTAGLILATGGFGWAVLALWANSDRGQPPPSWAWDAGRDPARIAVLYFDDHSQGGELDYLAHGITEELINTLGAVQELQVTSRNGVRPFEDAAVSSDSIARQLDVGTLVTGSVTPAGVGRVRVSAQLVDVSSGDRQLWSGEFEGESEDILNLQTELVDQIALRLRENLGVVVRDRAARAATDDEAWLLYHEAQELILDATAPSAPTERFSLALLDQAEGLLEEAHARDTDWTPPLVQLGWLAYERSLVRSEMTGFVHPGDSLVLRAAADRAVEGTRRAPEALEMRGVLLLELADATGAEEGAWRAAERDLQDAVTADPNRARALAYLSKARRLATDFDAARAYALRAMEVDAFLEEAPDVIFRLYESYLELKRWEEADRWCREGRRRFPERSAFVFCRFFYEALGPEPGEPRVAWSLMDSIRDLSTPEDWDFQYRTWSGLQVAKVLARNGMTDSAEAVVAAYAAAPRDRPWFAYDEAQVRLMLGDRQGALELLDMYLGIAPDRRSYLKSDWAFEDLWTDPEFVRLTTPEVPETGSTEVDDAAPPEGDSTASSGQ